MTESIGCLGCVIADMFCGDIWLQRMAAKGDCNASLPFSAAKPVGVVSIPQDLRIFCKSQFTAASVEALWETEESSDAKQADAGLRGCSEGNESTPSVAFRKVMSWKGWHLKVWAPLKMPHDRRGFSPWVLPAGFPNISVRPFRKWKK